MSLKKENVDVSAIKLGENGLISVIVQDYESGEVLLLSQMNAEAIEKTFETGYAHYYSPKQNAAVKYGATLGNTQKVMAAFTDNDGETLLVKVSQSGKAAPEIDSFTYFSNQIKGEYKDIGGEMFGRLQRILEAYKKNPEDGAYTSFLFAKGVDRIAKKMGEEAVELVIAAKNPEKEHVVSEAADLLYHAMVLLSARGVKISEVCAELCKRNR